MKILITGGGGFIGQKLAGKLAERGELRGQPIAELVLADVHHATPVVAPFPVTAPVVDITNRVQADLLFAGDFDVVYHLAAVVSGQAEAEFDVGMAVNLTGTLNILEAARAQSKPPVLVFASSLAVFGGEVADPVGDHSALNPQTSYGTQKAIGELLVNDYSRKGFIDGRALRLPTISVRPGKPNAAASSFMSSIVREPLQGQEAVCPVTEEFEHYYLSPRILIENLILAAELDGKAFGQNRAITLPGLTVSIREVVEAMRKVAGEAPVRRIRFEPDQRILDIVLGWRWAVRSDKADRLGFMRDKSFEDNVRYFLEDDIAR